MTITMNSRGMWFGLCLLFFEVTLTGHQRDVSKESPTRSRNWDLEVLRFEADPTNLWAGLANRSGEVRLVCIVTQGFSYEQPDDTIQGNARGASAQGCVKRAQFQLVKAGGTFFVRMTVPANLAQQAKGPIHVYVFGEEWAPLETAPRSEGIETSWHGTVKEADDRGRVLAPRLQ